jgi:hypothetical protein
LTVSELLGRTEILAAFDKLGSELARRSLRADIFVVGGAAMALAYAPARRTRDVDAVFSDSAAVYEAARAVARRIGLPGDWLNDAVRSYLLGSDTNERPVYESASLQVAVASPPYLLAMKLLAARVEQDVGDIRVLYRICGYSSEADGIALLQRYLPDIAIPDKTLDLLAELFGDET